MSLFLYMVLKNVLISFFYKYLSSFPSTTYWRDCLFSIVYPCLLCHRLIDHNCVGLFLFCFFDLCVYFCASTILFWLQQLCSIVWSQGAWFLQLHFSFSRLFWLFWGLLCFHINFEIICSSSVKNALGNLMGIFWICRLPWVVWSF